MNAAPQVQELIHLLGPDVLLLSWPWGMKGDKRRWKHLTVEAMSDPGYLRRLGEGNIGVALGRVSSGLCSLDIDSDEEAEEFMQVNERISRTLRSRGSRGCNLWWQITGAYPPLTKLKRHGQPWGEFRSTGGQTIIHGQHPDGMSYAIVEKVRPLVISMSEITWLPGMTPTLSGSPHYTEQTELTELSEETEKTEADRSGKGFSSSSNAVVTNLDHAVELALPTDKHQNHHLLFTLARAIKSLEISRGTVFSDAELRLAFDKWYKKSAEFLRDRQSRDAYWFEFLEGYENALHPLGINVVRAAWELALKNPPPPEAAQFESREVRLLVGLCFELQKLCGQGPFFLSVRTVQKLFGHSTHANAAFWLAGLRRSKVIEVVTQGGPTSNKASRFRYRSQV